MARHPLLDLFMTKFASCVPALVLASTLLAVPVAAQPDLAAGEEAFVRCRACHAITAPDGTQIQRGGRTGPDLYGVIGRPAASLEGFRYSPGLQALGATGFHWSEETLARFVADPTAFLRDELGDPSAGTAMTLRLRSGGEDLAAWLATLGPEQ